MSFFCLLHAGFSTSFLLFFLFMHLVELLLTFHEEKLSEIHFFILFVVVLLEEKDAESDIEFEIVELCGGFHEDNLH